MTISLVNSMEDRRGWKKQHPLFPSVPHIKVSCILEEYTPIFSIDITDILISGLCNTLKLAIFSLYVIYVLRLINILKYEIFFLKSKIGRNILVAFL
jgi:hypothetical protein